MNAGSSVLGSVLAIIIAIQFGLNVTLACGRCSLFFGRLVNWDAELAPSLKMIRRPLGLLSSEIPGSGLLRENHPLEILGGLLA